MFDHNKESAFNPVIKEQTGEISELQCRNCSFTFKVKYFNMKVTSTSKPSIYCPNCNHKNETEKEGVILK